VKALPLTREAFAPFGEVIDIDGMESRTVNQGFALRFGDVATLDVLMEGGAASLNIFISQPRPTPIAIKLMERHPLGSQAFYPLQDRPWLVLVCADPQDLTSYTLFLATGRQGVNYWRNVWHHPVLALDPESRFLIADRKGPGTNLDEVMLLKPFTITP
jgi:ureidoglycolate lyase